MKRSLILIATLLLNFAFAKDFSERKLTGDAHHTIVKIIKKKDKRVFLTSDGLSWHVSSGLDSELFDAGFKEGDPIVTYFSRGFCSPGYYWHYNHRINRYIYTSRPREVCSGSSFQRFKEADINGRTLVLRDQTGGEVTFKLRNLDPDSKSYQREVEKLSRTLAEWKEGDPIALISDRSLNMGNAREDWRIYNLDAESFVHVSN